MRYSGFKITLCHQGHCRRCSQLRPAIHPLGEKIDKAIGSTGINADWGERNRSFASIFIAKYLLLGYCSDGCKFRSSVKWSQEKGGKKQQVKTQVSSCSLGSWCLLKQSFIPKICIEYYQVLHTVARIQRWKKQTWSLLWWVSSTNRIWMSRESLGGCRERETKRTFFECLLSS